MILFRIDSHATYFFREKNKHKTDTEAKPKKSHVSSVNKVKKSTNLYQTGKFLDRKHCSLVIVFILLH